MSLSSPSVAVSFPKARAVSQHSQFRVGGAAGRESLPSAAGAPAGQHEGNDREGTTEKGRPCRGCGTERARVRLALHPSFP